jgi:hypothetical protein
VHNVNENGSDTWISGNNICAHSTDPDRILTTYTVKLDVRLNYGSYWYYHSGAYVERWINVWFRPRCTYSSILQSTALVNMTILLQESTT